MTDMSLASELTINNKSVMEALGSERLRALDIARKISLTRTMVNASLYSLLSTGNVTRDAGVPPVWSKTAVEANIQEVVCASDLKTLVIVDLGNIHDCLQHLIPYCKAGKLQVKAYADMAYNGYGVTPPLVEVSGLSIHRASTDDKNSADVELIWDLAVLLETSTPLAVIVVTKDQGYRRIQELAQRSGRHSLTLVTSWVELRNLVE
jgi:hypothetical protein